jgi:hypothetical protein
MKSKNILFPIYATCLLFASHAGAAVTYLSNNFEDGTSQGWTLTNYSTVYENGDVIFNMGLLDADINYSPNGQFSLAIGRLSGVSTLTTPLQLATDQAEDVTIAFNYNFRNGSGTRRLHTDYSVNGGADWVNLGFVTGSGSTSYTLLDSNVTLTDDTLFRFTFSDSGGAAGPAFVDNIVISSVTAIPEPSVALLGGFGLLALLRRRR